jgi:signal transduction histidine kinase
MIYCEEESTVAGRVKEVWRWRTSKNLLVGAAGVTVVISMFEIKLDPLAMAREVVSNFITSASITYMTATVLSAIGVLRFSRDWWRPPLLLILLAVGGVLGGLLGWGLNDLVFDYYISHPLVYLLITGSLAIVFGLAFIAYQNVREKLDRTVSRLAEKEVLEQKLIRLKIEAELEALRAKVNPHFLFNTLNSIASLIPNDPERAEDMVQRMSNLFRYVLTAGDRGMVPLREELDILGEYLEIEKMRLGGRLEYEIDGGDGLDGVQIPVMLLQPLVENSVKHGIRTHAEGGRVDVSCRRAGDRFEISIVDTGKGFNPESSGDGFGLGGVRQRLELYYPGSHDFEISAGEGAAVRITIPVSHEYQDGTGR